MEQAITEKTPQILDLGCGTHKYPGAIGIDELYLPGVDVVHDLESFPYPFPEAHFDKIVALNCIEHLGDTVAVFREVHRLLKPNGIFHFEVPHFSACDMYKDPTHKSFYAYSTVEYFVPGTDLYKFSYAPEATFEIVRRRMSFWGTRKVFDLPQEWLFNQIPAMYERKLAWIFPAYQIIVDLRCVKG
jgi:SAM-dependent methyltransferase